MSVALTVNGVQFLYPTTGNVNWGGAATGWAQAITNGTLSLAGGSFPLTAAVNFGASYGLFALYLSSVSANTIAAATNQIINLASTDTIAWNSYLSPGTAVLLSKDNSDNLLWNGNPIISPSGIVPVTAGGTGIASGTSGGILGFTGSTTLASSGVLTANQLIIGGGAGATPSTLAAGSQYQSLVMGAANPGYAAVNLAQSAAVTGVLPNANTTADNANTPSAIVTRDGSGNFSAGTITASLTGVASGNTTYTANQYGVVLSGSDNAMVVLAPNASTAFPLVSGGSSANPSWAKLTVAGGGTGLSSGTANGIPYFDTTTTMASTAYGAAASSVLIGNGSGSAPSFSTSPQVTSLSVGGVTAPSDGPFPFTVNSASNLNQAWVGPGSGGYQQWNWVVGAATVSLKNDGLLEYSMFFDNTAATAFGMSTSDNSRVDIYGIASKVGLQIYNAASTPGNLQNWCDNSADVLAYVDQYGNHFGNTIQPVYTTTATAASTTTLTVASTGTQYFTGSTTQTVALPVATTLINGLTYTIVNMSTGVVTVKTSGANTIQAMAQNTQLVVTCINTAAGTGTASWNWTYTAIQNSLSGGGTVSSVAFTVPASSILGGGTTITSSGTIALTTTGTSGGVPYFSSTSQLNTSDALTQYGVVYGGGAGAAPVATAAGTTGQALIATTSGAPTFLPITGPQTLVNCGLKVSVPTGTFTATYNNTVTLTSVSSFTNLYVGQHVTGTGIPTNTVITAISAGVSVTISQTTTGGAHSGATVTFGGAAVVQLKQADNATDPASGAGAVQATMVYLGSSGSVVRSVTSALSCVLSYQTILGGQAAPSGGPYSTYWVYLVDQDGSGTMEIAVSPVQFKNNFETAPPGINETALNYYYWPNEPNSEQPNLWVSTNGNYPGNTVRLSGSDIPSAYSAGTTYYVVNWNANGANDYQLALTPNGTAIAASSGNSFTAITNAYGGGAGLYFSQSAIPFSTACRLIGAFYMSDSAAWPSSNLYYSAVDVNPDVFQPQARYTGSTTSLSTGTTLATVTWTNIVTDNVGAFAGGEYFICPVPGYYRIRARLALSATYALNNQVRIAIGSITAQATSSSSIVVASDSITYAGGAETQIDVSIDDEIWFGAGTTILIQVASQGTSPAIISSQTRNTVSIIRTGS